ncbi:MAG: DUF6602 domain-containing protein [Pseudomonadota bacterium]
MPENIFLRLRDYYQQVGSVLRGEAAAASIFPNTTDIGGARERIYVEFLRMHAPSKCNIFSGGFLFDIDGQESHQLDVIITTDTTPRFDLHNRNGDGKSFSPVEGTLGIASIKSTLNKNELENALLGIASIPPTRPSEMRTTLGITILNYDDWPYKIIYASDGIASETLLQHLNNFYIAKPHIPLNRRPHLIHVAGKYVIMRSIPSMAQLEIHSGRTEQIPHGQFRLFTRDSDLHGIVWVLDQLQQRAQGSSHILFSYGEIINKVNNLPAVGVIREEGTP